MEHPETARGEALVRVESDDGRARALSFDDLRGLPGQIDDVGRLAPGRSGGAVPLGAVLAAAGVRADRGEVLLESADGRFSQTAPLEGLASAVLVYRGGDGPLEREHGGPVRFLVPDPEACGAPGVDRCTNVKDLARIRVRAAGPAR